MATDNLMIEFENQYREALKLVKKYIDDSNGVQDAKIQEVQEQLELISSQAGAGTQPSTLLEKVNNVIDFLKVDVLRLANDIFYPISNDNNNTTNNSSGGNSSGEPLTI